MRKLTALTSTLFTIAIMIFPSQGTARMSALTDCEMAKVTGQAGISIEADRLDLDISIDTIYYGDGDGLGDNSEAGYLSFYDISLRGSVGWKSPLKIDIGTTSNGQGNTEITALNLKMSDMTVTLDHFTIDAIRLGPEPGVGNSLGCIGIYGLEANITGDIQITAH